jgi:ribosomal-protein-alanine N-acetyltransferase
VTVRTARLRLEPATRDQLTAFERGGEAGLLRALGCTAAEGWAGPDALEAIARSGAWLDEHPEAADWWMHFFFDAADGRLIGLGGYKGAPAAGALEIGYEFAPSMRGAGRATEAARGMVAHAFAWPEVDHVIAHTLPNANASTNVLRKVGFRFDGEIIDPDDGPVWRWRLDQPSLP